MLTRTEKGNKDKDEKTGKLLRGVWESLSDAEQYAGDHGQSAEGISTGCLENLRSRKC